MSITRLILKAAAPLPRIESYDRYLFIGPHPDDIEIGAGATAAKLAAAGKKVTFLICMDGRYGLEARRRSIFQALPDATRTYFARAVQDKALLDQRAEAIVRTHAGMASAAAAQPIAAIPDAALIMPIQVAMLMRLTTLHGRELTLDLAVQLLGPLAARMAGRFAFEQIAKLIPVAGSIAGAAVAGTMTYALGMAFHTMLHGGDWSFDPEALKNEALRWMDKAKKALSQ